jgi:hypothetical protein
MFNGAFDRIFDDIVRYARVRVDLLQKKNRFCATSYFRIRPICLSDFYFGTDFYSLMFL